MGLRILVVDDSATVHDVFSKTFEVAQLPVEEVYHAASGKEALEILHGQQIDLVFADLNMPEMDGLALVDRMEREGLLDTTPVVIVSAERSPSKIGSLTMKGIRAYIPKPFTPEQIRKVVSNIIGETDVQEKEEEDPLSRAFHEVVDKYAFMFAEPAPKEGLPLVHSSFTRATMYFSGRVRGELSVIAPDEMCTELAANILGLDPGDDLSSSRGEDSLKELLNVLCGHIRAAYSTDSDEIEVSLPETHRFGADEWKRLIGSPDTVGFMVDDFPVLLASSRSED
jgi:two-component system, chemotaxis family, chemotaxis protein CheY